MNVNENDLHLRTEAFIAFIRLLKSRTGTLYMIIISKVLLSEIVYILVRISTCSSITFISSIALSDSHYLITMRSYCGMHNKDLPLLCTLNMMLYK